MLVWLCFAVPMVVLLGITVPFFIQDKYYYSVDEDKHSKFARKYHDFGESTAGGVCFIIALIFVFITVLMSLIVGVQAAVNAADETPTFKNDYATVHYALYHREDCLGKDCNHQSKKYFLDHPPLCLNEDHRDTHTGDESDMCAACMATLIFEADKLDAQIKKNVGKCDSLWIGWFYNPAIGNTKPLLDPD